MSSISKRHIGLAPDGHEAYLWKLRNDQIEIDVLSWGACLIALRTPDRHGALGNIVLSLDEPRAYFQEHPYLGSTVGRFANRIEDSEFSVDGVSYRLEANEGKNHLHGGSQGLDKVSWQGDAREFDGQIVLELCHLSPDGSQGYPGNLDVCVKYLLNGPKLEILFEAQTDRPTIVNLTNHSYFNLSAGLDRDISRHSLQILGDRYADKKADGIPTGELISVADTFLDFRQEKSLIDESGKVLDLDHAIEIDGNERVLRPAARIFHQDSGRCVRMETSQPSLQVYSGRYLEGASSGAGGAHFIAHQGFCLEAQNFPNAPKLPQFPSAELRPGQRYQEHILYEFSTE